jgi:hypothetical protein
MIFAEICKDDCVKLHIKIYNALFLAQYIVKSWAAASRMGQSDTDHRSILSYGLLAGTSGPWSFRCAMFCTLLSTSSRYTCYYTFHCLRNCTQDVKMNLCVYNISSLPMLQNSKVTFSNTDFATWLAGSVARHDVADLQDIFNHETR